MSGSGSKALDELRENTKKIERNLNNFGVKIEESTSRLFKGIQQVNQRADQSHDRVNSKLAAIQAKLDKLKEEKMQEDAAAKQSQSSNTPSNSRGPK